MPSSKTESSSVFSRGKARADSTEILDVNNRKKNELDVSLRNLLHPMNDKIFKRWMGDAVICSSFLSALLGKEVKVKKISYSKSKAETTFGSKDIILNIEAEDETYTIYNIESQNKCYAKAHTERCIFYASRIISTQLQKGKDYSYLKPVM